MKKWRGMRINKEEEGGGKKKQRQMSITSSVWNILEGMC
jgi:hypothetical protein